METTIKIIVKLKIINKMLFDYFFFRFSFFFISSFLFLFWTTIMHQSLYDQSRVLWRHHLLLEQISVPSFTAAVLPSYVTKVASNQKPQTNSRHLINLKFFFLLKFRLQEGVCVQLRDEQCSVVPEPRLTEQISTDTAE